MSVIKGFRGQYGFLSNFYPCNIEYQGLIYHSLENAFQAAKTTNHLLRQQFLQSSSEAKRLGRAITIRKDWDEVKLGIMTTLVRYKFEKDPLKRILLATGDCYIEETNTWKDTYWGVCNGVGENHLGIILMNIREDLNTFRE